MSDNDRQNDIYQPLPGEEGFVHKLPENWTNDEIQKNNLDHPSTITAPPVDNSRIPDGLTGHNNAKTPNLDDPSTIKDPYVDPSRIPDGFKYAEKPSITIDKNGTYMVDGVEVPKQVDGGLPAPYDALTGDQVKTLIDLAAEHGGSVTLQFTHVAPHTGEDPNANLAAVQVPGIIIADANGHMIGAVKGQSLDDLTKLVSDVTSDAKIDQIKNAYNPDAPAIEEPLPRSVPAASDGFKPII